MRVLGIGYIGLAITWDPPAKEIKESPFKDAPQPNEDPFGTVAEQQDFLQAICKHLQANEAVPAGTFCTHPDAMIYLNIPDTVDGYKL
ncbi:hypothetical protein A0J61_07785 [Choanephora cucurbitarum]|uniref:Uncharacterized protein n=1 Tax=Choanephora cucurbitarum TaxID=101091 RepID=A0A1C7N6C1_9FUNG|nr:hypothetical protein A0J61_07785 [Choanephora cucurbitarum]